MRTAPSHSRAAHAAVARCADSPPRSWRRGRAAEDQSGDRRRGALTLCGLSASRVAIICASSSARRSAVQRSRIVYGRSRPARAPGRAGQPSVRARRSRVADAALGNDVVARIRLASLSWSRRLDDVHPMSHLSRHKRTATRSPSMARFSRPSRHRWAVGHAGAYPRARTATARPNWCGTSTAHAVESVSTSAGSPARGIS